MALFRFKSRTVADPLAQRNFEQMEGLLTVEAQQTLTYSNGWRDYGGGGGLQGGRVYKDPFGHVFCSGLLDKNGGNFAVETMFTLPVGYRPAGKLVFQVRVAGGTEAAGRMDVDAAGVVTMVNAAGVANPVGFVEINAIHFRAA